MKKSEGARLIKQIALREGVSVEEVRREMQAIIDSGLTHLNPTARWNWIRLIDCGMTPTPENLIIYMVKYIDRKF